MSWYFGFPAASKKSAVSLRVKGAGLVRGKVQALAMATLGTVAQVSSTTMRSGIGPA